MTTMKILRFIPLLALCGCALTRPHVVSIETGTNGVMLSRKEIWLPAFVIWPANQNIDRQRASIGKTLSAGVTDAEQQGGGTNLVDALRAIGGILGNLRP